MCNDGQSCADELATSINTRDLYLELLKKAVLATLYEESSWFIMGSRPDTTSSPLKRRLKQAVLSLVHKQGYILAKPLPMTPERKSEIENGTTTNLFFSHSMIGMRRLNNLQKCSETVVSDNVPGT